MPPGRRMAPHPLPQGSPSRGCTPGAAVGPTRKPLCTWDATQPAPREPGGSRAPLPPSSAGTPPPPPPSGAGLSRGQPCPVHPGPGARRGFEGASDRPWPPGGGAGAGHGQGCCGLGARSAPPGGRAALRSEGAGGGRVPGRAGPAGVAQWLTVTQELGRAGVFRVRAMPGLPAWSRGAGGDRGVQGQLIDASSSTLHLSRLSSPGNP